MPRVFSGSLLRLTREELDQMSDSMTDEQIARVVGNCTKNNVGNYRRKLGVQSHGQKHGIQVGVKGVSNPTNRKYQFNERFFAVIDTDVKAYALGLLITDGHITKNGHRVRLSLKESDAYVLKQIASAADFPATLLTDKPRDGNYQVENMSVLNFNSTVMAKDLLALGLTSGKDNNLKLPSVPFELEPHLLRGIIDGDGYIPELGKASRDRILEISGRKQLLESINDCLLRHGLPSLTISAMRSIHRGTCLLRDIAILDWAYGGNPAIVLERKLKRYLDVKALHNSVFKVQ